MAELYNLARVSTSTAGTGTITLGTPISGFLSFSAAGVTDGQTISYGIADGTNSEVGTGVFTAAGATLTRVVTTSTNSNTAINLSGTAQVFITPRKEDLLNPSKNLSDLTVKYTSKDNITIHGADIASAATVDLEIATGDLVDVTGTTTITAITLANGHERTVRFTGALTLTHGASLVLPGAANIVTAAGDFAVFRGYAAGVVRCVDYSPATASGRRTLAGLGTAAVRADTDFPRTDAVQALTLAQQAQARANAGLGTAAVRADTDFPRTDAVQALTLAQQAQARANAGIVGRNVLINGGFTWSQRNGVVGTLTANGAYWADRWRYQGEASATCYGNEPIGSLPAADGVLSVPRSAAVQFPGTMTKGGPLQVIEGINCQHLRGKTVVLSALLAVNNATSLNNIKMGIIEWTGAEDGTADDPVASWNADGVTPTLAANWAFKNTPANLNVGTASSLYQVSAVLGTTFTNLAILIWNDDKTYAAGDFFRLGNVQLEIGSVASPFEALPCSTVLNQCQRNYRKSFDPLTPPQATTVGQIGYQAANSGGEAAPYVPYGVPMRATPTITIYSPITGAAGQRRNLVTSADEVTTGVNGAGPTGHYGSSAGHTAGHVYAYHYTAVSEI